MRRLAIALATGGLFLVAAAAPAAASAAPSPAKPSPTPTTRPSGVVFSDGFESGNLSAWTKSAGLVVESTIKHSGRFAAQGNTTNGDTYGSKTLPATYADGYALVWFDLLSASSEVGLLRLRTAADKPIALVAVTKSGKLALSATGGATRKTVVSTSAVSLNSWHSVELHAHVHGTSSTTQVWLDGSLVGALTTTQDLGTAPIGVLQIGDPQKARTYDVVFDDAAFGTRKI